MKGMRAAIAAAVIVAAAALILVGVVSFGGTDSSAQIVLPTETQTVSATTSETEDSGSSFVEITADNVQTVLQTLSPPTCYYQALTVERAVDGISSIQTVQIWRREELYQIEITTEGQDTLHYLTDGETLYLWYDGDDTALQTTLPEGWCAEDLAGIPSLEDALALEDTEILDAATAEPGGFAGVTCVYLQYTAGEGQEEYLWISLDSGLPVQAHTVMDGSLTCRTVQTELQTLTATDASFDGCFILPDGTSFDGS